MFTRARFVLLPAFASLVVVACGGSVEKVPDPNASANPTSPGGGGSSSGGGNSGNGTCTAAPKCNDGDKSFATQDAACIEINGLSCYQRDTCGATIWCQHFSGDNCDGYPECNPGYHQVKGCVPDSDCKTYSSCGVTVICQADECEGPQPICDQGDTQVSSKSDCLQDDAKCYSRTTCNFTIWCTGPA